VATELEQLLYAVLLAVAHLVAFGVVANWQLGVRYTAGPRDAAPGEDLSPAGGRLGRAFNNYLETLPWFAIAVIAAHLAERVDSTTIVAGWVYLGARVIYLPAYVVDIPYLRSLIWMVATFAILTIVFRTLG